MSCKFADCLNSQLYEVNYPTKALIKIFFNIQDEISSSLRTLKKLFRATQSENVLLECVPMFYVLQHPVHWCSTIGNYTFIGSNFLRLLYTIYWSELVVINIKMVTNADENGSKDFRLESNKTGWIPRYVWNFFYLWTWQI